MLGVFVEVFKFLQISKLSIDNHVFGLQTRITPVLFVALSLFGSQKQYFGKPILCYGDEHTSLVDTLCWVNSTYTLVGDVYTLSDKARGVGAPIGSTDTIYHAYYQWVPHFLFLQAMILYFPCYIWKIWEGGRLKKLIQDLQTPLQDKDEQKSQILKISDYLIKNKDTYKSYSVKFMFCEILILVLLVCELFFIDKFLSYKFISYGHDVLWELEGYGNVMRELFPLVTKCHLQTFGASGTIKTIDFLCVLPINIINEKIFLLLWFWLIILVVLSGIAIIYKAMLLLLTPLRTRLLKAVVTDATPYAIVTNVVKSISVHEWIFVYQLGKNMNFLAFSDFLTTYHSEIRKTQ